MKQNEADRLASNLIDKYGLPVGAVVETDPSGESVLLYLIDIHPNEGFHIKIRIGWRSLNIDFILGKFAADLLQQMANNTSESRVLFSTIARHIVDEKGVLTFIINGRVVNPLEQSEWPLFWKSLSFTMKKAPLEINTEDFELTERIINLWVERFYGCIISLCPLVEVKDNVEVTGLPEGSLIEVLVNRYERSRYNRSICINFHGSTCKACGIDFEAVYGKTGSGFIHVHHITPISQLGPNYSLNPVKDLVPVCPNCHAMLHKRNPPYTVHELSEIISKHKR